MNLIPESPAYRIFVLSAMRDDNTADQNHHYHTVLTRRLGEELSLGYVFAMLQCVGRYQGADERSIAVIAPREWFNTAILLGKQYGRDSIHEITSLGAGKLHFMDGRESETIGRYQAISQGTSDDYTHVLGTGHRFTFV